jgi:hypothetical protein
MPAVSRKTILGTSNRSASNWAKIPMAMIAATRGSNWLVTFDRSLDTGSEKSQIKSRYIRLGARDPAVCAAGDR